MPRLDHLPEAQARGLLSQNCLDHDDAPWTPLGKPLAAARLALVTTAGLHVRGDAPFIPGHQGYRTIPSATPPRDIVQSHTSIGFDRTGLLQDLNIAFPVDRVRDLAAVGELGSLATSYYSFLGAQRGYDGILQDSGPAVARQLRADGVDVVFLTGT